MWQSRLRRSTVLKAQWPVGDCRHPRDCVPLSQSRMQRRTLGSALPNVRDRNIMHPGNTERHTPTTSVLVLQRLWVNTCAESKILTYQFKPAPRPQETRWYLPHREAIHSGGFPTASVTATKGGSCFEK